MSIPMCFPIIRVYKGYPILLVDAGGVQIPGTNRVVKNKYLVLGKYYCATLKDARDTINEHLNCGGID